MLHKQKPTASMKLATFNNYLVIGVIIALALWIMLAIFALAIPETMPALFWTCRVVKFIAKWAFIIGLVAWIILEVIYYILNFKEFNVGEHHPIDF